MLPLRTPFPARPNAEYHFYAARKSLPHCAFSLPSRVFSLLNIHSFLFTFVTSSLQFQF